MKLFEKIPEFKIKNEVPLFILLSNEVKKNKFAEMKFVSVNFYNSTKVLVKPFHKPISKFFSFRNATTI
jgi:hypothetical protein